MPNTSTTPDASPGGAPPHGVAPNGTTRRRFLRRLGGAAGALTTGAIGAAAAAACRDGTTDPLASAALNVGTPAGALSLVYAYAQLMADFYARAAGNPITGSANNFLGMTGLELAALTALAGHKNAHRTALALLIPSGRVQDLLLFDFTSLDFSRRASVMGFAQRFEDLGVAAVNGLAPVIQNATDLTLVAKMGSAWARHAAVIRELNDFAAGDSNTAARTSFAATAGPTGLDQTADAATVVAAMQPFLRTRLELQ